MAAGLIPSLHGLASPMASLAECRAIWKLWPLTQGRPIRSSSWGLLRSNEINGEPLEIEAPIKNDGCLPVAISGLLEVQNRPMQILARMQWFWQRERETASVFCFSGFDLDHFVLHMLGCWAILHREACCWNHQGKNCGGWNRWLCCACLKRSSCWGYESAQVFWSVACTLTMLKSIEKQHSVGGRTAGSKAHKCRKWQYLWKIHVPTVSSHFRKNEACNPSFAGDNQAVNLELCQPSELWRFELNYLWVRDVSRL